MPALDQSSHSDAAPSLVAAAPEAEELRRYNRSQFKFEAVPSTLTIPLPDEPFVQVWHEYIAEAERRSVFAVLRERLVQFWFPIQAGISSTSEYVAAARKGRPPSGQGKGLQLIAPERLQLVLHTTAAGRIPVLVVGERADFVTLVQALARRNEPEEIPDSLGALMLSGYNNWDRVARLRRRYECGDLVISGASDWSAAFAHIRERKELYQDRLLLLASGPYSGVAGSRLGIPEDVWQRLSLTIRLEHESAHYVTRRLLGSMRNNLLDELIADYAGIVAAAGTFIANWLLCFLGIEEPQGIRPGGRLHNYRGDPPLSDSGFLTLQLLARNACQNMEQADRTLAAENRSLVDRCRMILALARLSLEELADEGGANRIRAHFDTTRVAWADTPPIERNPPEQLARAHL